MSYIRIVLDLFGPFIARAIRRGTEEVAGEDRGGDGVVIAARLGSLALGVNHHLRDGIVGLGPMRLLSEAGDGYGEQENRRCNGQMREFHCASGD